MANRPKDRIESAAPKADDLTPKIYLIVNGKRFVRPSLETYFAEADQGSKGSYSSDNTKTVAGGVICTCNKVCTCNPQCACQGYNSCSCVGYDESSCSCVGHTSSGSYQYCSCVPVH